MIRLSNISEINDNLITKKIKNIGDNHDNISSKIINIDVSNYDGYLYDFTIEDNHNYVANGMIVSNTHVHGIVGAIDNGIGVIGIAPGCSLYSGKVLNKEGLCPPDYSWIIKGLQWAIDINADVVNMSLGAPIVPPDEFQKLIRTAVSKGMILIAASGNEQLQLIDFPGRYEEVISVAAMDKNGNLANYSNVGPNLDFIAPGTDVYSTYLNGEYATISGTSMAAPFITGVTALLLAYHRNGQEHVSPIRDYHDVISHINKFKKGKLIDMGQGVGIGILDFNNQDVNDEILACSIKTQFVNDDIKQWKELTSKILCNWIEKIIVGK